MRQLKVFLASLCLAITALGAAAPAAIAENANFSQQILPIDCVFQVIDTGTQQLLYLTPAECGQILPPPVPPKHDTSPPKTSSKLPQPTRSFAPQRFTPFNAFAVPQTKKIIEKPQKTITIEPSESFQTTGVTLRKIKPGQTISFAIGNRGNSHHSLKVGPIHQDYVVISFDAEAETSKLHEGEEKQYNITGDNQKDIAVKVDKIQQDYANLQIRQLNAMSTDFKKPTAPKDYAPLIITIVIVLGIAAAVLASWLFVPKISQQRRRR